MNHQQARKFVQETFTQPFDRQRYAAFIGNLLNHLDYSKEFNCNRQYVKDAFKQHVTRYERLATYTSPDQQKVDILVVHLADDSKLTRARTALRNFVADYLKQRNRKDAALVAFVSPSDSAWRFSYIRMEYATVETPSGQIDAEERLTPARRFSYLVGPAESCHTAQTRFLALLQNTQSDPSLAQIEDAFSVEAVTKEFFQRYKNLFVELKEELDRLAASDRTIAAEFHARKITNADFSKKLLGQIVFLYFLQKKGWLGVPKGGAWGQGPHDFLRKLANGGCGAHANFFNDVLEPLFYDTLATDRGHEAFCQRFNCHIPFLNGGLFEPLGGYDWHKTEILLPDRLFANSDPEAEGILGTGILDVFDRYNFTVNEAEPLEKEVAIDPEMLGKVFENLLEVKERKSKGSFYTPREIVHYMCQESLINYLDTAVNSKCSTDIPVCDQPQSEAGIPACAPTQSDTGISACAASASTNTDRNVCATLQQTQTRMSVPRSDIETFIHTGDQAADFEAARLDGTKSYAPKLPKSIEDHARLLDEKLAAITVCDPAIGSGAFPVGMMQEIVRARTALTPYFNDVQERSAYHFKRHAIQNCLYGVDIDPSAVEIAKLRLWLSLVVDEENVQQIKPLPNLDYKIVVGNSLLGFPFISERLRKIEALKEQFFGETDHDTKMQLKEEIDSQLSQAFANSKRNLGYEVNFDFQIVFSEVFRKSSGFDVVIANPPYVSHDRIREEKIALHNAFKVYDSFADIYCYFVERGIKILAQNGVLVFITSNSYIKADYGLKLRQHLSNHTQIVQILNIEQSQVFETAIVNVAVLIATRTRPRESNFTRATNSAWNFGPFDQFVRTEGFDLPTSSFSSAMWTLARCEIVAVRRKIEISGMTFKSLGAKIRLGIATGYNDAFLIDAAKRRSLVEMDGANAEIIVPIIRGRDIERYGNIQPQLHLIAARNGVNVKRDYPTIFQHFDSFGHRFRSRGAKGQQWWNLRSCGFYEDFEHERIVWIELSDSARFTICPSGVWCLNSAYFMLTPQAFSLRYVLGLLNSRLIDFYFRLIAQTSGMGVTRWINLYVEKFPLPSVSPERQKAVEHLVGRVLAAKAANADADTSALENEIDRVVYQLYNLTPEEIAIVEGANK